MSTWKEANEEIVKVARRIRSHSSLSKRMRYSAERWNSGSAAAMIAFGWADEVEAFEAKARSVVDEMGRAPQDAEIPANLGFALLGLKLEVEKRPQSRGNRR